MIVDLPLSGATRVRATWEVWTSSKFQRFVEPPISAARPSPIGQQRLEGARGGKLLSNELHEFAPLARCAAAPFPRHDEVERSPVANQPSGEWLGKSTDHSTISQVWVNVPMRGCFRGVGQGVV